MEWLPELGDIRRARQAVVALSDPPRHASWDLRPRRRNPQTPHHQDEFDVVIYGAGTFRKGKQTLSF